MRHIHGISCVLLLVFSQLAGAADWPQWQGPKRDSLWREDGIVERFPKDGLKVKWRSPVALGYSGPAVADGKVFVMDYILKSGKIVNNPGSRTKIDGTERVQCFDAESGKQLWEHKYPRKYNISFPAGPRCTPTVDGDRVYTLGAEGDLCCLNIKNGEVIWSKDLNKEYQTETPFWGHSAHPLVHGDMLYCVVGGEGSVAVAFDKKTGKEIWKSLSASGPGYCPPSIINHGGAEQLLIWHAESLNSLNPKSGKPYWSVPLKPDYGMAITMPRLQGDLLYACGYVNKSVLLKLDKSEPAAKEVWRGTAKKGVSCDTGTLLLEKGIMYGVSGNSGMLTAARLETGKQLWQTAKPTTGTGRANHGAAYVVKHKDRYFIFSETGDLILAKLSPEGYKELGRFHVLEPTNSASGRNVVWSHPAFAQRCVFARNDKEMVCVNLAAGQ